jgi:ribonuclease HII
MRGAEKHGFATLQALACEAWRLSLLTGLEESLRLSGYRRIAGVDEVGRGCLAGPVVVGAVIPDLERPLPGVDDSKRLSPARRRRLAEAIRETAVAWAVVPAAAEVIDRINVLEATRGAMAQAVARLSPAPDCVLVDAVALPECQAPSLPLVRADSLAYAVACASILAKVERDECMVGLDRRYPQYGFAGHKGYGAPRHIEALAVYGPTPEHRLTFRSVLPRREAARA